MIDWIIASVMVLIIAISAFIGMKKGFIIGNKYKESKI